MDREAQEAASLDERPRGRRFRWRNWLVGFAIASGTVAVVSVAVVRIRTQRASAEAIALGHEIRALLEAALVDELDGADPVQLRVHVMCAASRLDAGGFELARTDAARLATSVGAGWRVAGEPALAIARLEGARLAIEAHLAEPRSFLRERLLAAGSPRAEDLARAREELARARLAIGDELGALDDALAAHTAFRDVPLAASPPSPSAASHPTSASRSSAPDREAGDTTADFPRVDLLVGRILLALGDLDSADAFLREAARDGVAHGEDARWIRSDALAELACIAGRREDLDGELALRRDALAVARPAAPELDRRVARRAYELAYVVHDLGPLAWDEARELYAGSLAARERHACGDLAAIATHLANFALLEKQAGRLAEAEPLLTRAIAIQRRLVVGDDRGTATMYNNLGTLRLDLGDRRGAEEALLESLAVRRRLFPEGGPDVAETLINLGSLHHDAHDFERAARFEHEAVVALRATSDGDDRELAIAIDNLGATLQDLDRYAESEKLAREALAMLRRIARGPDPDLAQALDNLGTVLYRRKGLDEAERLLLEAVAMGRAAFPRGAASIAMSLRHLAWVHERRKDFARAGDAYGEALEMLEELGSSGSLRTAIEEELADCLRAERAASRRK